jgi:DNA recombination protein RmuC
LLSLLASRACETAWTLLAGELLAVRGERDRIGTELATLKANAAHFDEQKRLLIEAQDTLRKEFEAAGAKVLEGAQEAFLKRAQGTVRRFRGQERPSGSRVACAPVRRPASRATRSRFRRSKREGSMHFGQLTGPGSMRIAQRQEQVAPRRAGSANRWRNAA